MDKKKYQQDKKEFHNNINLINKCEVSKASTELMLHRVSDGKKIDFPFNN